jgi:heterodisulfide reductase subunit A
MAEVGRNANIKLYTYSQVRSISGRPGNYSVKIYLKRRGVDPERCKSCGVCEKVCPVSTPDEFNEYLSRRKAVYLEFPQAVPSTYVIDFEACTRCGVCVEQCPSEAIDLEDEGKTVDLSVGVIVLATGYDLYDAEKLENYGYGVYEEVVTMMELERLTSASGPTSGYIKTGGRNVGKIAILLCAGSRDKNHVIYCSRICCMYALKQAYVLKKMLGIDVYIYYTDIRATGKGYEELYWRNQEAGVFFVRGKIADVWHNEDDKLVVMAEDTLTCSVSEEEFDMLALATPLVPTQDLKELADKMNLSLGEDGFIQEKHPKLDPVDTMKTGIFACGCAISPKDVRDTVSDALGAAAKASLFLKSENITTSPEKAFVVKKLCDGCGICLDICPSSAITVKEGKAEIDPFLCVECGACIPTCPKEDIEYKNFTTKQLSAQLRGINFDKKPDEIRIITFVDKNIGYTDVDFLGLTRINYPEEIYIVPVPSTAILGLKQILSTFASGADGILIIEGQQYIDTEFTKERMLSIRKSLKNYGIENYRIRYSHVPLPVYKKAEQLFTRFTERIKKLGPITKNVRDAIKEV